MTCSRTPPKSDDVWGRGFVLIEVLAAIFILGLLVVSLGTAVQRACASAIRLRDEAALLSSATRESAHGEAWEWGSIVDRMAWSPGPQLIVTVAGGERGEGAVGIWADGWLLGEWPAPEEGTLTLGPVEWGGIVGQELVVRLRSGDGPWGPPCRTVVPDQYGNVGVVVASVADSAVVNAGLEDAVAVSHVRYSGAFSLRSSYPGQVMAEAIDGMVAVLGVSTRGLRDLVCGDSVQSWLASEHRRLDVYW